jgi:hypothetical protein
MAKLTRKQAEYLVAAGAAVDFLTGQRISTPIARRINAALRRAAPTVARTTASTVARLGGTALGLAARGAGAARFVAMRHPAGATLGLTYVAVKNRDQIMNLLEQGYEIAEDVGQAHMEAFEDLQQAPRGPGGGRLTPSSGLLTELGIKPKTKRKRSSYNKAVSSAMKAVKKSKFLGKPGKFTSPKKAFATVNRTVSRIKKGAKVGTKGVSGVIKRAVRRIL